MKPSNAQIRSQLRLVWKTCEITLFSVVTASLALAGLWTIINILIVRANPFYVFAVAAGLIASPLMLVNDLVKQKKSKVSAQTGTEHDDIEDSTRV